MYFDNEPFGNSNAGRRAESEIQGSYVDLLHLLPDNDSGSIHLEKSSVIVGKKGSGKTHLLKHLEIAARSNDTLCEYCPISDDLFKDKGSRALKGNMTAEQSTSFWADFWRLSINIAALSRFACKLPSASARKAIRENRDVLYSIGDHTDEISAFMAMLREEYPEIVQLIPRDPISPVVAMTEIQRRYRNRQSYEAFRSAIRLDQVESDLAKLLHHHGKIWYFIDGVDEFALQDPLGWIDIQRGLYKAAFLSAEVRKNTQYLRLTVAIRAYVYQLAAQDPQNDRAKSQVLFLNWERGTAEEFMKRRLQAEAGGNFSGSEKLDSENPLESWLGFSTVTPDNRSKGESVVQYLLRHTRLSPRNIVMALNHVAKCKNQYERENRLFNESAFKSVVSDVAKEVGDSMLQTASEEITALAPLIASGVKSRMMRRENLIDYHIAVIGQFIREIVTMVGSEVCDRETFEQAKVLCIMNLFEELDMAAATSLGEELEGVLWRSSVIAYGREDDSQHPWQFAWSERQATPIKPRMSAARIGFHSSLIDLDLVRSSEDGPVF